MATLPQTADPRLLVGAETSDDAGVVRLRRDLAIVHTADFFTPLVDDPYQFGRIAAANALSDVYAMGGRPLAALNLIAFPCETLPGEVMAEILRGGAERAEAAGALIVGGHSIVDTELKYGMAVTGVVHPERLVRNGGAQVGDALVLTKPLGTGIVATGIKRGATSEEEAEAAIASMVALNAEAGRLLGRFRAHACTDVTGFGLAGHALEMAEASPGTSLVFEADALALLPGAARLAEAGHVTGGSRRNREFLGSRMEIARTVPKAIAEAVVDPQTSGGLLVAMAPGDAREYVDTLKRRAVLAGIVGRVEPLPRGRKTLVRVV